jgi:hypothetical protein
MKTLFIFLTGYCVAEIVSHVVFYYGKSLPFQSFGMNIDNAFNNKALIFYGVLAIIFAYLGFFR